MIIKQELKKLFSETDNYLDKCNDILSWIEDRNYKGYDPYDLKGIPTLIWMQKYRYTRAGLNILSETFPLAMRILFNIKPEKNAKAMALIASSYLNLFQITKDNKFILKARDCLQWLKKNRSSNYERYCWGYPFDWQSKILIPKETPSVVVTSIVGDVFLKAYQLLKDNEYLQIAKNSCDFLLEDLNVDYLKDDEICFSYTPLDNFHVHNANLFAASLLFKVGTISKDNKSIMYAEKAVNYSLKQQNPDGSWYYWGNPDKIRGVIDAMHTGYVLRNLYEIYQINQDEKIFTAIHKGYNYFINNLMVENLRPKHLHNRDYLIDIHHCAETIICFSKLNSIVGDSIYLASNVIRWCFKNLYNSKGYFYYRKYPFFTSKIPFIRWGQAWMLFALTEYILTIKKLQVA